MVDRTLYISGQLGLNPHTMEIVEGGVEEETIQALKNMHMILRRAQSDFSDVIKTTILLKDMKDFQVGSKNKQGPCGTNIIFRSMAPLYPLGLDEICPACWICSKNVTVQGTNCIIAVYNFCTGQ